MLGALPQTLNVGGIDYKIRTDYRDILIIISAFSDKDLTDQEKVYICLKRIFYDFDKIPGDYFEEAYKAASDFMECNAIHEDKPSPRVVNWGKDEQLIFPAINKAAGIEVRSVEYMHWWTFMGYFQSIDSESTWGYVLMLRQKKAKGKKFEKYEREFYNANRALCEIDYHEDRQKPEDAAARIFEELLNQQKGGDA